MNKRNKNFGFSETNYNQMNEMINLLPKPQENIITKLSNGQSDDYNRDQLPLDISNLKPQENIITKLSNGQSDDYNRDQLPLDISNLKSQENNQMIIIEINIYLLKN